MSRIIHIDLLTYNSDVNILLGVRNLLVYGPLTTSLHEALKMHDAAIGTKMCRMLLKAYLVCLFTHYEICGDRDGVIH